MRPRSGSVSTIVVTVLLWILVLLIAFFFIRVLMNEPIWLDYRRIRDGCMRQRLAIRDMHDVLPSHLWFSRDLQSRWGKRYVKPANPSRWVEEEVRP
jgi:hypothetical protein